MKYFLFVISILSLFIAVACRNDFDDVVINTGQIQFSTNSIHLDTLFTKVRSNTRRFTIKNTSNDNVVIPRIALERGSSSFYTLNINGFPGPDAPPTAESGKIFENIEVLAKDSIFGFVETTLDFNVVKNDLNENGEYTDKIILASNNINQQIELFTKINDADFIFNDTDSPERPIVEIITEQRDEQGEFIILEGYNLTETELNVTDNKALVIYGYAIIADGKTLLITAGSRLHFHENSGLIVQSGGRLEINGALSNTDNVEENLVIIEGDRIDKDFNILPGQWDFIWIQKGATASIENCVIKNAITPILIEGNGDEISPSLILNNVQIYNAQTAGIQATATNINAFNLVIDKSGNNSLNIEEGGTYQITHATIANYFDSGFSGNAISLNNSTRTDSDVTDTDLNINFLNCIIDGPGTSEITVTNSSEALFNLSFKNCLLKTSRNNSNDPVLDINNSDVFINCTFNEDPNFKNTNLNQLQIGKNSAANGNAKIEANSNDIIGTVRNATSPDIGAYESIDFDEASE